MTDNPIKFGTDGWRGIIAEDFTFDNVRICAQAMADYLKRADLSKRGLVIGYDTRFASEDFAAATAEVIAGNDIKAYLCSKPTPTPIISYGVIHKHAGGAIIITASHNPGKWNGFKIKSEHGSSAPTEVIDEVEKRITDTFTTGKINRTPLQEALSQKLVEYLDLTPVYSQHISELINLDELRCGRLKIVVDSMYGAGAGYFKELLCGGSSEITEINGERNPLFPEIQPEPIAANLNKLSLTIRKLGANVGLATDGDADRIGIIDENGTFLTTQQVFALLCLYLLEIRNKRGMIVKTTTTTSMLNRLGDLFEAPVHETAVGFKHIAPIMIREDALIGGEESGGYGFRGHVPERDGILAGLYFLDLMQKTSKSPSLLIEYLHSKVGPHFFKRADVKFPESERQEITRRIKNNYPQSINGVKVTETDTKDGFRFILEDNSWLLIRFSGTEPLLRIYAESNTPEGVEKLIEQGKIIAGV
ncbi:phosphoglucomutase/phosphomannomutase family protein [Chloroflexota bacterium]